VERVVPLVGFPGDKTREPSLSVTQGHAPKPPPCSIRSGLGIWHVLSVILANRHDLPPCNLKSRLTCHYPASVLRVAQW
jgi:hypothetical protein